MEEFTDSKFKWLRTGIPRHMTPSGLDTTPARLLREKCRRGDHQQPTCGEAGDFVQVNIVGVPRAYAFDFLHFTLRNSRGCPLLDITSGRDSPSIAASSDLSTDLPLYDVHYPDKMLSQANVSDLTEQFDLIFFLLGCSFSWESILTENSLPPRHIDESKNVSMYRTNIPNVRCGPFGGNLVVSMRPYPKSAFNDLQRITGAFPGAHGAPIHYGNPEQIGIVDLSKPDFGDAVNILPHEEPVFWACGVTSAEALRSASLPIAITHHPGHMFVTDLAVNDLRENE